MTAAVPALAPAVGVAEPSCAGADPLAVAVIVAHHLVRLVPCVDELLRLPLGADALATVVVIAAGIVQRIPGLVTGDWIGRTARRRPAPG